MRTRLALRLMVSIPGGYALSAAWVAAVAGLLAGTGLLRSDAVVLASMLGFVFYLVFLVWAFAERSVKRLWWVTAGGIGACLIVLYALSLGA